MKKRKDYELPEATKWGWRYHHLGIPYDKPHSGETHHKHLHIFVRGFDSSPYGIEWMRFEENCPMPEIVKKVPHIAFEVDDLDKELKGKEIVMPPGQPQEGVRTAMIIHDEALIELIEFSKK